MYENEKRAYSPRRIEPCIQSAPRVRQIYWCGFGLSPILPEIGKLRPALIVSFKNKLRGHCLVLPISSGRQDGGGKEWAHKLETAIGDAQESFVVCNHLYTVSTARLQPFGSAQIPRLAEQEFNLILRLMYRGLPRLPSDQVDF